MTLTKEILEREIGIWERNGIDAGTVMTRHYVELCRLALLGLERDATIAAAQSAGHKAGRAAATAEYKAEIERLHGVIKGWELKWSQRDERAERVGRAAILAVDNGWSAHEVYTHVVEAIYGEPAVLSSTDCPKCGRHDGGIMRELLRIDAPLGKCRDEACPYRGDAMEDAP